VQVEAEEEPFEEELVANALSEMRKRESMGLLAGGDTKATVYPARLEPGADEQKRPGLFCWLSLLLAVSFACCQGFWSEKSSGLCTLSCPRVTCLVYICDATHMYVSLGTIRFKALACLSPPLAHIPYPRLSISLLDARGGGNIGRE